MSIVETAPAIYLSLELSQSNRVVTILLPGSEIMSKHVFPAGNGAEPLKLLDKSREKKVTATHPTPADWDAASRPGWLLGSLPAGTARCREPRCRVRRFAITALARKLLIAPWRYAVHREVWERTVLKAA
jgi:hypothetical protein